MSETDTSPEATSTVDILVRPAAVGDYDAVVELDSQTSGLAKPDYWRDIFDGYVGDESGQRFLLVADVDNEPAGFVVGEIRAWEFGSPPCGWVFALGVSEDFREHRVGSRLVQDIFARFRESGVTSVRTSVSRRDTLNLSFFRSLGMTAGPYVQLEMRLDE